MINPMDLNFVGLSPTIINANKAVQKGNIPGAPGMLPFWTALFAFIIVGERPTKLRSIGLIIILFGAFLVGSYSILRASNAETWKGHFLFLAGSGMWSMYSVYFRKSGINPLIGQSMG